MCSFPSAASLLLKQYHGGYIVIRLARAGHNQPNRPFYRIVAAFNKKPRDGKFIEQLGTYDPLPNIYNEKLVGCNFDRIKYWYGCGAHITKPVAKLLGAYSGSQMCITAELNITHFLLFAFRNYVPHKNVFDQGGPFRTCDLTTRLKQYSFTEVFYSSHEL